MSQNPDRGSALRGKLVRGPLEETLARALARMIEAANEIRQYKDAFGDSEGLPRTELYHLAREALKVAGLPSGDRDALGMVEVFLSLP